MYGRDGAHHQRHIRDPEVDEDKLPRVCARGAGQHGGKELWDVVETDKAERGTD
jgi:hypothetical protein